MFLAKTPLPPTGVERDGSSDVTVICMCLSTPLGLQIRPAAGFLRICTGSQTSWLTSNPLLVSSRDNSLLTRTVRSAPKAKPQNT
jgi:hypothetical protein